MNERIEETIFRRPQAQTWPEYIVAAWAPEGVWRRSGDEHAGKPGFAEWAVWPVTGVSTNGGPFELRYERKGGNGPLDDTPDREDGVWVAYGTVKWDGCGDYEVGESEDLGYEVMLHACSLDDIRRLFEAIQLGYRLAARIVGAEE